MPVPRNRRIVELVAGGLALLVFVVAYIAVLDFYKRDTEKKADNVLNFSNPKTPGPDRLDIEANVVDLDPRKGEMKLRLQFAPMGETAEIEEYSPAANLTLLVNNESGKQEVVFPKGKRMNPLEVTIALDGEAADYPFDEHEAVLFLGAIMAPVSSDGGSEPAAQPAAQPAADEGGEGEEDPEGGEADGGGSGASDSSSSASSISEDAAALPIQLTVMTTSPGVDLDLSQQASAEGDDAVMAIDFKVKRAGTVTAYTVFVMAAMWGIALLIFIQSLALALRGRKPEADIMAYMAALLFAIPALRETLPGIPPVGSYTDVVAFFWAEGITALALIISLGAWLFRAHERFQRKYGSDFPEDD